MLIASPVGSHRLVAIRVNRSGIDFAHIICKRSGGLQRRKVCNNRALKLRADRCDLIALGSSEGDFICDHTSILHGPASAAIHEVVRCIGTNLQFAERSRVRESGAGHGETRQRTATT